MIAEPFLGSESGLGLTLIEHGGIVGVSVGLGVSVTVLFKNPFQRRLVSSYRQSSTSPLGWTATARPALPLVK